MEFEGRQIYRILVADDEKSNLDLFKDVLSGSKFDLVTCRQGDLAVGEVKKAIGQNQPFSVAFLDVRMPPGPDGVRTAEIIRSVDPNIEFVIITGYSDIHPRQISERIPPSHKLFYVHKPFHIHEISQAASSLSAKWEIERELKKSRKELELRVRERTGELARANEALIKDIAIRRETERVLRENEERYRILTESMADGVVTIKDNTIEFANAAFANMLQYDDPAKITGKPMDRFIDPEFRKQWHRFIESILENTAKRKAYQFRCLIADSTPIWMEGRFNLIYWHEKPVVLATTRDISEQKERELALEEETQQYQNQINWLQSSLKDRYKFGEIIGKSAAMQEVYQLILNAGASDTNVVIYGESGTGKELIAETIHQISDRKHGRFVPVNCGAVPESLFESEFFGHKKGAFTGAVSDHLGFFDQARGGTLFLDEVAEFTVSMQAKMLRAMEGGGFTPVGGTSLKDTDVRIVAATNRDLRKMVKEGLMREDFFYRLNVVPIRVPALRERKEDVPLLVEHFMAKFSRSRQKPPITGRMMDALKNYHWPGNIRQLQNVLQRYTTIEHFDMAELTGESDPSEQLSQIEVNQDDMDFRRLVQQLEKRLIVQALEKTRWHKAKAAELLGLPRRTFFRKLKDLEL